MVPLLTTALGLLKQGRSLVEATVIRQQGSTPRGTGAKMIVAQGPVLEGTVGGGLLEGEVIRTSQTVLHTGRSQILSFDLTGQDAAAMGMICGGCTQVLLDFMPADAGAVQLFEQRLHAMETEKPGHFLTIIHGSEDRIAATDHCLIAGNGEPFEPCGLPQHVLEQLRGDKAQKTLRVIATEDGVVVVEALAQLRSAYFFGAGHVVLYTARFAAQVGFRVVVIDDRAAFADPERFPQAARTLAIPDFHQAFDDLEIDENAFLVIATRGHIHDRTVLAQALKTRAAYIGMIGSRSKKETIYKSLLAEGVTREALDRVHCPIGLPIAAETPEEIGISIVAEMIQRRAELTR
jgi:xanthine dehydrogenase accessory factor